MKSKIFIAVMMIAGSAVWYYFNFRHDDGNHNVSLATRALENSAVESLQRSDWSQKLDKEDIKSSSGRPPYGYSASEVSNIESKGVPGLAVQFHQPGFRQLPPEKQMMMKEIFAREIAKGDDQPLGSMVKQIDVGSRIESDDLFEVLTMSTGFAAAKALVELAFNATNEDVRKKALGAVSHLYKSRGNKRKIEDITKIEQYLVAALGRADLSDREFSAVIQAIAGFGSAYGIQTVIDLWDSVPPTRQEIIASEIKIIFQKTAAAPLVSCAATHSHLWKACGLSLAMIGSEESISGILISVAGNTEKKAESLLWFHSVNKIPAIKTLLAESKANQAKDEEYYSQVRTLAEGLLESLKPMSLQ